MSKINAILNTYAGEIAITVLGYMMVAVMFYYKWVN